MQPMKERGGKKSPRTWQGLVLPQGDRSNPPTVRRHHGQVGRRKGKPRSKRATTRARLGFAIARLGAIRVVNNSQTARFGYCDISARCHRQRTVLARGVPGPNHSTAEAGHAYPRGVLTVSTTTGLSRAAREISGNAAKSNRQLEG